MCFENKKLKALTNMDTKHIAIPSVENHEILVEVDLINGGCQEAYTLVLIHE